MKKYFSFLVLIGIFLSCTDRDDKVLPACGMSNPTQDLEWLKKEIDQRNANPNEDMKYCYIVQATLNGEDVFVYQDCNPLVNKVIPFYNCEGTVIPQDNGLRFDDLKNKVVIWKRDDFVCQVSF